ncbi:MAG TPA: MarR family transcriptional regulator [Roseiarcus sp.]|jgi:DNA-binding MarR family transcriptional regulator
MPDVHPQIGILLNEVARLMRKRFEQRTRDQGLTRAQWQTIVYLARQEGVHQACLAEMLEIEPMTLVRILDRLEQRGVIERRQDPEDRRAWRLYLKEAARPLLAAMQPLGEATRAEALEGVSDTDRDRVMQILTLMKTNLAAACQGPTAEKTEPRYG